MEPETAAFGYLRARLFLEQRVVVTFGYPRHAPWSLTASGGLVPFKIVARAFVPNLFPQIIPLSAGTA
jgi:hypothetical protein